VTVHTLSLKLYHIYVCYMKIPLYIQLLVLSMVSCNCSRSWNILPMDAGALLNLHSYPTNLCPLQWFLSFICRIAWISFTFLISLFQPLVTNHIKNYFLWNKYFINKKLCIMAWSGKSSVVTFEQHVLLPAYWPPFMLAWVTNINPLVSALVQRVTVEARGKLQQSCTGVAKIGWHITVFSGR
jgi:hypothetical protein